MRVHCRTPIGYAGILDTTAYRRGGPTWPGSREDSEPSFFMAEVLKYLKFVYNPNHIVHGDKVKKILDDLQDKLSSPEDSIFEEAHEKIMNYCHRR